MARDVLFDQENSRFSYRLSALPVSRGRILLQCPVGTQNYALVGGHCLVGEEARSALRRELREELHADAVIGRLIAVGEVFIDWGRTKAGLPRHCHQIGLYFMAEVDEAQLPEGDSFFGYDEAGGERFDLRYEWVPLERLRHMLVYPPEVTAHLLAGAQDVLHFVYSELSEEARWD